MSQIDSQYRVLTLYWESIWLLQLLGIPARILVPSVTQLFRSKWLHFFFECGLSPFSSVQPIHSLETLFSVAFAIHWQVLGKHFPLRLFARFIKGKLGLREIYIAVCEPIMLRQKYALEPPPPPPPLLLRQPR